MHNVHYIDTFVWFITVASGVAKQGFAHRFFKMKLFSLILLIYLLCACNTHKQVQSTFVRNDSVYMSQQFENHLLVIDSTKTEATVIEIEADTIKDTIVIAGVPIVSRGRIKTIQRIEKQSAVTTTQDTAKKDTTVAVAASQQQVTEKSTKVSNVNFIVFIGVLFGIVLTFLFLFRGLRK